MSTAEELINNLSDKNNKIKYSRNFFKHKIYPFFTREPERAKFKNGFHGVLGSLARLSLDLDPKYDTSDSPISNEKLDLDFLPESLEEEIINGLTSSHTVKSMNHPFFINYIPSSNEKDSKGEIEIANLLLKLFNLDTNEYWKKSVGNKKYTNLLEKIMLDSLKELNQNEAKNEYLIFNKSNYKYMVNDLEYLTSKKDFFMKNIHNFFAFYYFQYIMQTTIYLNSFENQNSDFINLYFTLESEKITSTRQTVKEGFNLVTSLRRDLLVNDNLIGYINFLIESEDTYSIQQILEFEVNQKDILNQKLISFLKQYAGITDNKEFDYLKVYQNSLLENIKYLRTLLLKDLQYETQSRFFKSIDEIGNLYFLKSRGRLGKVLSLNTETIILLSALIVRDNKMILSDVFKGFEERGVWLDRYTKEEIVELYERMNILDKKSDSGEAKYVKPIL